MRNIPFVILATFIVTVTLAQSERSGVFVTAGDFQNNKLTLPAGCKSGKDPIRLNSLLNKPFITVRCQGSNFQYNKAEIFGYRNGNKTFRFFQSVEYEIMNMESIWLYSREQLSQESKGSTSEKLYYFSTGILKEIYPLTVKDLKQAYAENHKFHDLLDTSIKSEKELMIYDSSVKNYRVVHLLMDAQNKRP